MKKLLLFVLLFGGLLTAQEWRKVTSATYESLSGICFLDANTGWSVGSNARIIKTSDGGISWTEQHFIDSVELYFYTIQFIDQNIGFAGGTEGYFKKTTDGGSTWNLLASPDTFNIQSIYFADEQTGWVLGSSANFARIQYTTDGGSSWTSVLTHSTGDLEAMDFFEPGKGIVVGGGVGKLDIYYTSDGINWTKAPAPSLGGFTYSRTDIRTIKMLSATLAYAEGWGSYVGAQPSIHLKSTDGGATWTFLTQLPENRTYVNINGSHFKDENNGLSFGGGSYDGTVCVKTTDGGLNWIPISIPLGFTADDACGIGDNIWITGNGAVAYSSNFGDSWILQTEMPSGTLNDIKSVDDSIFYAAGYNGIFLKSADYGNSWQASYSSVNKKCPNINGLFFLNKDIGYAAKINHALTKTTDGGLTWFNIMQDSSATGMVNEGVHFFDENTGLVAGRLANGLDAIYKTIDGGLNWSTLQAIVNDNLNGIAFADANKGVVIGNDSKIYYTTDVGETWAPAVINNLPTGLEADIKGVTFIDNLNGAAVGDQIILTTADAGAVWEYISVPWLDEILEDVAFRDAATGWAVGDRYILETNDGGKTWININDTLVTLKSRFYSITIDSYGFPWIGSGSSCIYTSAPLVSVDDNNLNIPEKFNLKQNYPNPFNPSTIIEFSINKLSSVSLKVYDLLGREVSVLMNENKMPGTYKVNFDGSGLTSGVYFCTIKSGDNSKTIKMLMIK